MKIRNSDILKRIILEWKEKVPEKAETMRLGQNGPRIIKKESGMGDSHP